MTSSCAERIECDTHIGSPDNRWREMANTALRIMDQPLSSADACHSKVHLTCRERELLQLASNGLTMLQIANSAGISLRTVTTHLANIYEKMGVNRLHQAVAVASRAGLLNNDTEVQSSQKMYALEDGRAKRLAAAGLLRLAAETLVHDDGCEESAASDVRK